MPSLQHAAWRAAYQLTLMATVAVGLPAVVLGGLVDRRLVRGLGERLGSVPRSDRRPAWFQAASVGELRAFEPLETHLHDRWPELPLALSTTTPAGRHAAEGLAGRLVVEPFHFPVDAWPLPRRALARLRPRAVVLVETELWPGLLHACASRGVPVAVVNGRIGDRSFERYRHLRGLLSEPLASLSVAAMRTRLDAERMLSLGARPERVHVTGNLKFDAAARLAETDTQELPWARGLGLTEGRWVVFGSTAQGEEVAALSAFRALAARVAGLRCVLAPRRPQRWDEVAELVRRRGLPLVRRSAGAGQSSAVPAGGVLLLDTVGELARVYRHAEVAFVGGSLVRRGGQNLLEPAAVGCPVLFGPHVFNFRDAEEALLGTGGGRRVTKETLERAIDGLLADRAERERASSAARAAVLTGRGAARRTADLLEPVLDPRQEDGA